jgi:putative transposase
MPFINAHRERWGVEPICQALEIAPSSYYAALRRAPSARQVSDQQVATAVARVHRDNFGVYGVRKVWRQLGREGLAVGRDRVGRLMRRLELSGVRRGKPKRTTRPRLGVEPAHDLVERCFRADSPNRLWVADLTYVWTSLGFSYTAFVIDAFSRRIVGWRVLNSLRAELALDALEMALWTRRRDELSGLVHHSDRGGQYVAIRYTERLAEIGASRSVGSRGDSYDNALAETVVGLYKAELIHRRGPWRTRGQVELATARWVYWWNHRRLHGAAGDLPPAEFEAFYYRQRDATSVA